MNIIIAGCGRYGALLANRLSSLGHSVVIIDRQENAFKALSTEFSGFTITGNAGEVSVLREAKIETADCLLSMCNEDTLNLMVTQVAKYIFGVPKVIARVYKPSYESIAKRRASPRIGITTLFAHSGLFWCDQKPLPHPS